MKTALISIILITLFSCHHKESVHITATIPNLFLSQGDTSININNGIYYYQGKPFSGHLIERYSTNEIHHHRSFFNGKEEGWQYQYYPNGSISEKRFYEAGEKQGAHTGWYDNGSIRFEYHFNKGAYDGEYKEWYASGQLYKHIHYTNNNDDWGKGWRENGKVYMNYVQKNGRRFGLINSNLCYTVK